MAALPNNDNPAGPVTGFIKPPPPVQQQPQPNTSDFGKGINGAPVPAVDPSADIAKWNAAVAAQQAKTAPPPGNGLGSNGESLSGRGATFTPPPIQRDAKTMQAYLALNPDETKKSDALLAVANGKYAAGVQQMQRVQDAVKLSSLGPSGIKQQQAILNQNGYNIPVTGVNDAATQNALQAYATKTFNEANTAVQQAIAAAHPGTIRGDTNAGLAKQTPSERAYLLGRAQNGIQTVTQALAHTYGPDWQKVANGAPISGGPVPGRDWTSVDPQMAGYLQTLAAYKDLQAKASDPLKGYDNATLHQIFLNVMAQEQAALQQANADSAKQGDTSILSTLKQAALGTVGAFGKVFQPEGDYIGSVFSAGFVSSMNGDYWTGLQAAAAAAVDLPFLSGGGIIGTNPLKDISHAIAPSGGEARKGVDATNTRAKRDVLVSQGDLLSLGQTLTGNATPQFIGEHGQLPNGPSGILHVHDYSIGQTHLVSGTVDAFGAIASDPLTYVLAAAEPFKLVGDMAGDQALAQATKAEIEQYGESAIRQFGRMRYLATSATGRALIDNAGLALDDLSRTGTMQGVMSAIKGLPDHVAAELIAARAAAPTSEAASAAARQVVSEAFQMGLWNPEVGVVRQITNALAQRVGLFDSGTTEGAVRASVGKAVQLTDRVGFLRTLAAGRGPIAGAYEAKASEFITSATDVAARAAGKTVNAIWNDSVRTATAGLDMGERFYRLADKVAAIGSPSMHLAFDDTFRPFFNNATILSNVPVGSYMEAVLLGQGEPFDAALRKLEVAVAFAGGEVGSNAGTKQMIADLARGYVPKGNQTNRLVATAAKDIGLKLPKASVEGSSIQGVQDLISKMPVELQQHFTDILGTLNGVPGKVAALQRDLLEVSTNRALREEVLASIKVEADRVTTFQEAMGNRPGLGFRRGPVQKLARLALSNVDVAPDPSMRFLDATANESLHAYLRGRGATRTLDAFFVKGAVKDSLVAAMENVKTEAEFAAVAERIARAGMDAHGIENPQAVLDIMRAQGHFTPRAGGGLGAIHSLDENGNIVTDIQTLAQRLETTRMPLRTEMVQAYRKAILDGTQDPHMAQLIAAKFHHVFDAVGGITFHIAAKDGSMVTLSQSIHAAYRQWKFMVVSNAAMPIIGAVGGFIGAGGSITDRLKGAGLGFGLGASAAFGHYLFKVTGLEDRTRMLLAGGMTPDTSIPGHAAMMARRYDDPFRRTLSEDLVKQGNYDINHFENDFLVTVDPAWVVVDRKESRAPDAWFRIHNFQIHPESDPVMATLLREKAGMLANEREQLVTQEVKVAAAAAAPTVELTPLEQAMKDMIGSVSDAGVVHTGPDNAALLEAFPNAGTKTFYRGESAADQFAPRGSYFIPADYNPGVVDGGLKYAQSIAGADGIVYSVELPINEKGIAMVGERAPAGELGWMLHSDSAQWADAAQAMRPVGGEIPKVEAAATKTRTFTATVIETDRQAADKIIADFLKTDEGKIWTARAKGASMGAGNPDETIAKMRAFLDRYSTPDLAATRVSGGPEGTAMQIDRQTLARKLKAGEGPQAFHAQDSWRMPKGPIDLYKKYQTGVQRYVLSGPSNVLNRRPWMNSLFSAEYDRLVLNGVPREEAQQIADSFAVKRVNSILHRFDEPSRFAAKLDSTAFVPFQHAREDLVRAYAKLISERPFHALRVGFYAARIFNDAAQTGLFTKNEFTGQWEVTLPMNGRLGQSLYGSLFNVPFTANVKDLLFVTNGPDDMGFAPQPGGPFWSLFSRALAVAAPQVFEGDNAVHHWLLRYGPSGDLLPKSSNRLWMGLTGTTPPWEVANQASWKNEHEHVQIEIAQELMHAHIVNNPSDTTWMPTQSQVDEATSHYYETWAFHSAVSPIGAFPVLTSQSKYDAARNAYTLGGTLPFNPDEFLKKYPEFTPYIIGSDAKYVGPDDLATINKLNVGAGPGSLTRFNKDTGQWDNITPKYAKENYQAESNLGYRKYSWMDWQTKFKKYQRTSEYFKALDEAHSNPVPAQREAALIAVDHKFADVVAGNQHDANIKKDVYTVLTTYPKAAQAAALQRIKTQYGLTNVDMLGYQKKVTQPSETLTFYKLSPWTGARGPVDVLAAVDEHMGKNTDPFQLAQYVATLSPAEQYNFWNAKRQQAGQDPFTSAHDVMREYTYANNQLFAVERANPQLFPSKYVDPGAPGPSDFIWPTITSIKTEEGPAGDQIALKKNSPLSQFAPLQQASIAQDVFKEIGRAYPQYTKGVTLKLLRENSTEWGNSPDKGVLGRGSNGVIYINTDQLGTLDAQGLRFLIAKELGQANAAKFINTPKKGQQYAMALGAPANDGNLPTDAAYLKANGHLPFDTFRPNDAFKTAVDSFGRDFAQALGYGPTDAFYGASKLSPQAQALLQAAGILPQTGQNLSTDTKGSYVNPFTKLVTTEKANISQGVSATYQALDKITAEMQVAAAAKSWKVYYALKGKEQLLYAHVDALHNQLLNKMPDLTKYYEDLHAASIYDTVGNTTAAQEARHQASIDLHPNVYVQISEQKAYAAMPPAVQRQYLTELTQRLDMPHDKTPYNVSQYVKATTGLSTMYWEYLTPTQQHLMEAQYPSRVANWQYLSDYYLHGAGSSSGKYGSKKVPADLAQAYAIMAAASKRGNMPKPPSYAAYLALPYNPAAKSAFLSAHPDVKAYLAAGPFANMSAVDKAFVSKTLAKYGKGFGGTNGSSASSRYGTSGPFAGVHWAKKGTGPSGGGMQMDLAWAKEQLTLWSKRPKGALAPEVYNTWVNMPSGPDKATYMTQHPEIAAWIQLGPMSNMPEDYKNVVRDIMVHYNGWTVKADPLGNTITQFYALPSYARNTFLLNHPELEVYWAATRTPAQQAKVDLQDSYFKIQDQGAKREFLAEHPELQQQFLDARNQRYNKFLNQVAVFMGANPTMFNEWMTRQNDVMAELLQRFAEPQLIREVGPGYVATGQTTGDATRTRVAQRAPRNRGGA